jgi:hypothetical protein
MKFNRECANSYAPSTSSAAPDQASKIADEALAARPAG